jgi:hypothetical protein
MINSSLALNSQPARHRQVFIANQEPASEVRTNSFTPFKGQSAAADENASLPWHILPFQGSGKVMYPGTPCLGDLTKCAAFSLEL